MAAKVSSNPHLLQVSVSPDRRIDPGSIIPIAPGRMRNIYFPQRKAEYVTSAQIRTLSAEQKDMVFERDFGFGIETSEQEQKQSVDDVQTVNVEMRLLSVRVRSFTFPKSVKEY